MLERCKTRSEFADDCAAATHLNPCMSLAAQLQRKSTSILPNHCYVSQFVVDSIRDERKTDKGEIEYAIKWLGWPAEDMTWEPAQDIRKSAPNAVLDWNDEHKQHEK